MQQVTILGSATLLGQHLTKVFREQHPEIKVKLWDCSADGELDGLAEALKDTDTVFNLHEVQDFSLVPNASALQKHNVDFVAKLIDGCKAANDNTTMLLVHLSSVYLQCSTKWPNVYGSEQEDFDTVYRKQCPFPEYCQSKFEAEKLIRKADTIGRVIARVGPLYGEGDCHSLVCDFILATQALGSVPRVGDSSKSMGVLQFTYAANAAHALLACAQKLPELAAAVDEQHQQPCETVLISDHTPVRDFYSLMLEPLMEEEEKVVETNEEEEEKNNKAAGEQGVVQPVIDDQDQLKEKEKDQEDSSAKSTSTTSTITTVVESKAEIVNEKGPPPLSMDNSKNPSMDNNNKKKRNIIRLTGWRVPFLLFYLPYALLCALIRLFCHAIGVNSDSSVLGKLPSPNLVYLLLRHWSFYSERKLRLLFDFRPPFDWSTSMQRSRAHYRQLKPEQIRGPSWLPAFVDRRRRPVEDGKAKADDE